jgi:hypothetical protein
VGGQLVLSHVLAKRLLPVAGDQVDLQEENTRGWKEGSRELMKYVRQPSQKEVD